MLFLFINQRFYFKMKKQQKDSLVTVIRTKVNEFVKSLNIIYVKEIVPEILEQAKDDATKNLPSATTKTSIHTNFITSRFNRLVVGYKNSAENSQQQYHANKDISEFKKLKNRLKEKLNEVSNFLRIKTRAIENLKSYQKIIGDYNRALVGIVFLSCSEAVFASTSFQIFVSNLLYSLIIGVTFAVALYYSAVVGAKVLKLTKTRLQFIATLAAVFSIIGLVFFTLGSFRLIFLDQMSDGENLSFHLSPLSFMFIQLFFYSCAILLKYFFTPEKSEFEQYHNYKTAKKDIVKLTKQEKQLEESIKDLEKNLNQSLISRRTLITHSADIELEIDALYKDAFHHYVKTNLHHRSDNEIPLCFQNQENIPALTLFFQDESLLMFNEADLDNE